jgi:hypothetical protein
MKIYILWIGWLGLNKRRRLPFGFFRATSPMLRVELPTLSLLTPTLFCTLLYNKMRMLQVAYRCGIFVEEHNCVRRLVISHWHHWLDINAYFIGSLKHEE